jgi:WD40 repeat protein
MRLSIGLWLAAVLLASGTVAATELKQASWPSRVIQVEPAEEGLEPPVVTALGLQAGGRLMVSGGDDHLVRVWNQDTGELVTRLQGHRDWIRTAAFTPDGSELITAGNDRQIFRWDVNNQWQRTLLAEHDQAIVAVAIHPEGDRLAVVGFDGRMHIYNLGGETLATWGCPCRDMRTVVYSPSGAQLAAAGRNGKIRIWNAADGTEVTTIEGHRQRIRALLYTADGSRLISAGEDRQIKGWNPVTGESLFVLSTAPSKVQSLALFGDRRLASAGSDNRIRLWDLETLTSQQYLQGHTGSVMAMESDGDVLLSGAYDATVRIWQIADTTQTADASTPVSFEPTAPPAEPRSEGSRYQPAPITYQGIREANRPAPSRYRAVDRE